MNDNDYRYLSGGAAPVPSTLFGVTAGLLAFIALGMAASLSNPNSTVSGLAITIGAAVAAAAFALIALRTSRVEESSVSLRTPTQIRPVSSLPRQLDKAA